MTASIQSYPTWSPLANGPDADDAWEAIFAIAHDLQTFYSPEQSIDASLASGAAGIALFFSYLHLACPGRGHDEVARRYLDRIAELTGVAVQIVSVGARRDETLVLDDPLG